MSTGVLLVYPKQERKISDLLCADREGLTVIAEYNFDSDSHGARDYLLGG